MFIPVKKRYNVTGILNGKPYSEEHEHYSAQRIFRRLRKLHPTISQLRAEVFP